MDYPFLEFESEKPAYGLCSICRQENDSICYNVCDDCWDHLQLSEPDKSSWMRPKLIDVDAFLGKRPGIHDTLECVLCNASLTPLDNYGICLPCYSSPLCFDCERFKYEAHPDGLARLCQTCLSLRKE